MSLLICPVCKKGGCDGEKVSCPHRKPHEHIPTCDNKVCSRLSHMSNVKPACIPVIEDNNG